MMMSGVTPARDVPVTQPGGATFTADSTIFASPSPSPASPGASFAAQASMQQPQLSRQLSLPPMSARSQTFSVVDQPTGMTYKEFVDTWTDSHVAKWLKEINCGYLASNFSENDIRGDLVLELDHETLAEMGVVSVGDRVRILNAVKILRQKCSTKTIVMTPTLPTRPRVTINGVHERPQSIGSPSESPVSRLGSRAGRPTPLRLNGQMPGDLPRLVQDQAQTPDTSSIRTGSTTSSNNSSSGSLRPLPQQPPPPPPPPPPSAPTASASTLNPSTTPSRPSATPTAVQTPRSQQGHHLPSARSRMHQLNASSGRRTPLENPPPAYVNQSLPPVPSMPTPTVANNSPSWANGNYGLPSDPRQNKGPSNLRSPSPLNRSVSPKPPGAIPTHVRNSSLGASSPSGSSGGAASKLPPRPSTSSTSTPTAMSHPYSSLHPVQQQQQKALSPINEAFTPGATSSHLTSSASTSTSLNTARMNNNKGIHSNAPSLDDLEHQIVKFNMAESEGDGSNLAQARTVKIKVGDCSTGVEVLQRVLRKVGRGGRLDNGNLADHVNTDNGVLTLDGWGISVDGHGPLLSESELLAICQGPHNTPVRERGLTIRQAAPHRHAQPSASERDDASSFLSVPGTEYGNSSGRKATQRASAYKVLSDFDGDMSRPSSPSSIASQGHHKGKLREFLGQRPPSELISNHLPEYFPFTEKKVLARTARNSMMMRPKRLSVMSTASWSSTAAMPSRFSSSTAGSGGGGRRSIESNRAASERALVSGPSSSSPPPLPPVPPLPERPSRSAMDTEAPPRVSLSTHDGRDIDLNTSPPVPTSSSSHLLPPVRFPTESLSDSMESLTRLQEQGLAGNGSAAAAAATRRMSYMKELRSKKDRSDTASVITMDQVTAEVQSRRESMALERMTDNDSWSLVGGGVNAEDEAATAEVAPAPIDATDEFDEEDDGSDILRDEDEDEEDEDTDDDDDDATDEVEVVDEEGKVHKARNAKWIKGALIGKGSFGEVYLGLDAATGFLMAVKQVKLPTGSSLNDRRTKEMVVALEREIELLNTLKHDNIVQYFYSAQEGDYLNIFLEYVPGGSVAGLLQTYGMLAEPLAANFVRQILDGLAYLHGKDIIHRDIKGANILVDNRGGVKISDFGISKKVEDNFGKRAQAQRMSSLQGSVFWMAPEVIQQKQNTKKADIWSVGCVVVEMLTGEHPWAKLTQMQAIFKIGTSSARPENPADITPECEDFLNKTFELNLDARPSAAELRLHPWIRAQEINKPPAPSQ